MEKKERERAPRQSLVRVILASQRPRHQGFRAIPREPHCCAQSISLLRQCPDVTHLVTDTDAAAAVESRERRGGPQRGEAAQRGDAEAAFGVVEVVVVDVGRRDVSASGSHGTTSRLRHFASLPLACAYLKARYPAIASPDP